MAKVRKVRQVRQPKPQKEENRRLSFSQVDLYLNCARKYKFKYIDKIPTIGFIPNMMIGTYCHKYSELVLTSRIQQSDMTSKQRDELRDRLSKEFKNEMLQAIRNVHIEIEKQNNCLVQLEEGTDKDELVHQFQMLTQQWDKDLLPEIDPIAVEREINMEIGGYPFLMYIDLIRKTEQGIQVIDWKVTKKAKGSYAAKNSLQLSIYALACDVSMVGFGSWIRPMDGKENNWKPRIVLDTDFRSQGDYKWAEEVIRNTGQAIDAGVFPTCSPENFLCTEKFCPYWTICRGQHTAQQSPDWFDK